MKKRHNGYKKEAWRYIKKEGGINSRSSEFRSCVKVEMAVLGLPS